MKQQDPLSLRKGIYLILNPAFRPTYVLDVLPGLLELGLAAIQCWDHFPEEKINTTWLEQVCEVAHRYDTPVLINNRWNLLMEIPADGVHFDTLPENLETIQQQLGKKYIYGLTCQNNLDQVLVAERKGIDYISFCSLYPSTTSNSCERVELSTLKKMRALSSLPFFLAGGIRPHHLTDLNSFDHAGIALVSAIWEASDPIQALKEFQQQLAITSHES
ncbi:MAG: thiamine phosphate synthase [Cytophagaceae bacterium]|nr:thiamine phosphate synthase [Cytophagaceae bacterium]